MEKTFTSILALAAAVVAACMIMQNNRTIGTISGAEWEYITIGAVTYSRVEDTDLTEADKDRLWGKVSNDEVEFQVYTVEGDTAFDTLYCRWEQGGYVYVKEGTIEDNETD